KNELKTNFDQSKADVVSKLEVEKNQLEVKINEEKEKIKKTQMELDELNKVLKEKTGFVPQFLDMLFSSAHAEAPPPTAFSRIRDLNCVETKSCPNLLLPKGTNPNLNTLNQYLGIYEAYYQGLRMNNPKQVENASLLMEKNRSVIENVRNVFFGKGLELAKIKNTRYADYEKAKILEEEKKFTKFYESLSVADQNALNQTMNPMSEGFSSSQSKLINASHNGLPKKVSRINPEEMQILRELASRLGTRPESSVQVLANNSVVADSVGIDRTEYDFNESIIHPKEANLFEIIHVRFLKVMQE
ncbi:MAG: hypothetical protein K2Q18_11930, partial [Bdellovibrionales bacterium]|nr:hypothetical protein [Bdellovibrionales bacterium]